MVEVGDIKPMSDDAIPGGAPRARMGDLPINAVEVEVCPRRS
jgi:hypothetical protein